MPLAPSPAAEKYGYRSFLCCHSRSRGPPSSRLRFENRHCCQQATCPIPVRRRARLNPGGIEQRDPRPEPREPGAAEGRALRALRCRTHAETREIFVRDSGISLVRYQQDALPQPALSRRQSALGARARVCPDGIARRPNLLRISHCHIQDAGTRRRHSGLEAESVFGGVEA